jgi:hypothetical protein
MGVYVVDDTTNSYVGLAKEVMPAGMTFKIKLAGI